MSNVIPCRRPRCLRAAEQRGLCNSCRQVKAYRDKYALPKQPQGDYGQEMTSAELDAMIEAQRATMPGPTQAPCRSPRIGKAGLFKGL